MVPIIGLLKIHGEIVGVIKDIFICLEIEIIIVELLLNLHIQLFKIDYNPYTITIPKLHYRIFHRWAFLNILFLYNRLIV